MRLVIGGLLLLSSATAAATSTKCTFYPPATAPVPSVEFLGYERVGPVLIHGAGGPSTLPYKSWKVVTFDERSKAIHFVYTNPGDPALPPSFTVKGRGRHTQLLVGGQTYTGELSCGS
ncbi:hypothetical protein [Lysobacter silvisoli]|nr:hypothetical protein [Lysobacter silvisoli]